MIKISYHGTTHHVQREYRSEQMIPTYPMWLHTRPAYKDTQYGREFQLATQRQH